MKLSICLEKIGDEMILKKVTAQSGGHKLLLNQICKLRRSKKLLGIIFLINLKMTLIACTKNYDVPFLTSDILMSSRSGSVNFQIPTNNFNVVPFLPTGNEYKPDSFAQKMYIIKDNVCVVFAGDEFEIKSFLIDFRVWCSVNAPVRDEHIKQFLSNFDLTKNFSKSACFIIVIEHTGQHSIKVGMFNVPKEMSNWKAKKKETWQYLEDDLFEEVYAAGSGTDDFLNTISQKVTLITQHEKGSVWHAIQTNVSLIAKTLALEKISLTTLKKNYGGGFESVFYNGEMFEKISNIVYVISYSQFKKDGDIDVPFPQLFLYYTYIRDIFRIVAIEIEKAEKKIIDDKIYITAEANNFKCRCFDVKPLDYYTDSIELIKDYSFKTDNVAMGYSLIGPDNSIFSPAWVNRNHDLTVTYDHEKKIELILSLEITETVRNSCKEYFARTFKQK